jgi:hypothetical protein
MQLSPQVAESGEEEVESQKLALGIEELEKWTEDDYEPDIDEDTLEEILDFLETEEHGLDEEYERAREYLGREPEPRLSSPMQPPLTPVHHPHRIDSMFSTLREE